MLVAESNDADMVDVVVDVDLVSEEDAAGGDGGEEEDGSSAEEAGGEAAASDSGVVEVPTQVSQPASP